MIKKEKTQPTLQSTSGDNMKAKNHNLKIFLKNLKDSLMLLSTVLVYEITARHSDINTLCWEQSEEH